MNRQSCRSWSYRSSQSNPLSHPSMIILPPSQNYLTPSKYGIWIYMVFEFILFSSPTMERRRYTYSATVKPFLSKTDPEKLAKIKSPHSYIDLLLSSCFFFIICPLILFQLIQIILYFDHYLSKGPLTS